MKIRIWIAMFLLHSVSCCLHDWNCSLNGVCRHSICECDAPWTGLSCGQLSFIPSLRPSAAYGIHPNVSSWGGNAVLGEDGKYHLFVSEMANGTGLSKWRQCSQVVHAISTNPGGPYTRKGIALLPEAHNPYTLQHNNNWYIFHIGSSSMYSQSAACYTKMHGIDNSLTDKIKAKSTTKILRNNKENTLDGLETISSGWPTPIHTSKSPDGPWSVINTTMPSCVNPSPWILPNGTWAVVCTGKNITLMVSTSLTGEWIVRTIAPGVSPPSIWPHKFWEDPMLWVDKRGNWHILAHTYSPHQDADRDYVSGHLFSNDGWKWNASMIEPYRHEVVFSDGTMANYSTMERPKLLFNANGIPTHLFNGVSSQWPCSSCGGCTQCKITPGRDWTYTMVRKLNVSNT